MKRVALVVLVLVLVVSMASDVYCQDAFRKLGRGFANVIASPLEIPNNIINRWQCDNSIFTSAFIGLPLGVGRMIMRVGVGAFEVVTFPFPVPAGYCPVMEPEYVWEGTGDNNGSNYHLL